MNSYEAEARRLSRFVVQGATQEKFVVPPPLVKSDFPFTLDLRHA